MIKNQTGSALVQVLLAILIIASIVGMGWYIWATQSARSGVFVSHVVAADTPVLRRL